MKARVHPTTCKQSGSPSRRAGVNRSNLNRMLKGKRNVVSAVLKALGLRKVYTPNETLPAALVRRGNGCLLPS
jgi:hypothetical protein